MKIVYANEKQHSAPLSFEPLTDDMSSWVESKPRTSRTAYIDWKRYYYTRSRDEIIRVSQLNECTNKTPCSASSLLLPPHSTHVGRDDLILSPCSSLLFHPPRRSRRVLRIPRFDRRCQLKTYDRKVCRHYLVKVKDEIQLAHISEEGVYDEACQQHDGDEKILY